MTLAALTLLVAAAWAYLALAHGRFHQSGPTLPAARPRAAPPVAVVVPARDEAGTIAAAIGSLLAQDYAGPLRVVLVDDGSTDDTAAIARALPDPHRRLTILASAPRPPGWAGKLWAVHQGVAATTEELLLLTDADIAHAPDHLARLVAGLETMNAGMVSEMVRLNCDSPAERALVPAFVYFFALLYPFARANDPRSPVAAAAGGTVLVRRQALAAAGGIAAIKGALIDDVALATAIKPHAPIWLGHTDRAHSIRPYPAFADIWRMIARSAYVQLRHSPPLLAGSLLGMGFLFLLPPILALSGAGALAWIAWLTLTATFEPATRRYGYSIPARLLSCLALPLIALFYLAATVASALSHHFGRGVVWKARAYAEGQA